MKVWYDRNLPIITLPNVLKLTFHPYYICWRMKSGMQLDKLMREMKCGDHQVTLLIRYAMSRLARPVYSRGALWYPPLQCRCTATAAQSAMVKGLPLRSPLGRVVTLLA